MQEIFNSSGDIRRLSNFHFDNLYNLINSHIILCYGESIPVIKDESYKEHRMNHGGEWHNEVCGIMAVADKKLWRGNPKHEEWICGKRVDIFDRANNIVIECGDSDPDAIRHHLLRVRSYIIAPFQQTDKAEIKVYRFIACSSLALKEYNERLITDIMDIWKKKTEKEMV